MNKIKELKRLAEFTLEHFGGEWDSALVASPDKDGNYHAIICEEKDEIVISSGTERKDSWLCDYLEAVDPQTILTLIKLLEKKGNHNE